MEQAAAAFGRLGFALTPLVAQTNADPAGGPPVQAGTGNRCAMLRRGYLEILAAVPGLETPLVQQLQTALARYTGLHLIAFTVADAAAAHARITDDGFHPLAMVHLRRPVETPDGAGADDGEAVFSVVRLPPGEMAEGRIQMLTQHTPELVWQDRFITRDNGIAALSGVLLCMDDPAEAAGRFARFTGRRAAGGGDYFFLALDRGRLGFATPDGCRTMLPGLRIPSSPFMAAVAFEAPDAALCRRRLESAGVAVADLHGMLRVGANDAMGAEMVIHGPAGHWPPGAMTAP